MLTPDQFVERWQTQVVAKSEYPDTDKLVTLPSQRVAGFPLLPETAGRFLAVAGLPQSCAPCLSFDDLTDGLRHLWEVYSPGQWKPEEKQGFEHFGMIGSDGAGSPICIDERDGRIVLIDHELLFNPKAAERRETFVSSSVAQLAESLLVVNSLPNSPALDAIRQIDEPAVAKGTFWSYEAANLSDDDDGEDISAGAQKEPWWKFW